MDYDKKLSTYFLQDPWHFNRDNCKKYTLKKKRLINIKNYIEEYSKGYLSNEYFSKKVKLKIFLLLNFHQIYFNIYKIKLKLGYYLELYLSKNEDINIENNQ